jgi:diguanylate cyclase (GGDEF)-like protein
MKSAAQGLVLEGLDNCLRKCSEAPGGVLAIVHLDVDGFRRHAVEHGSLAACNILRAVHEVLRDLMQPGDLRTRFSEHRVLVALPGRNAEQALEFVARARLRLREYRLDNTISIGVVQAGPHRFAPADEIIGKARQLVFQSKSMGGGRTLYACFEPDAPAIYASGLDSALMSDFASPQSVSLPNL